jgi:cytosine deaminase
MFLSAGVTAIRSHVDVTERINLIGVDALLDVREGMRGLVDIQLVTLATSLSNNPRGRALLQEALRMGVDVVGGAPALDDDPRQHIDFVFALASQFGRPIDLHMDESDDPKDFWLSYLAEKTIAEDYQGRVMAGHCCALAAVDQETAARTIERVREARISVVTLPSANLYLQGRSDTGKVRRGITRIRELLEAGVPVCCGSDNIQDPFNPFGRGDLLLVANLLAHAAHLGSPTEQAAVLEAITIAPAAALRLPGYGLALDCAADLVVLDTLDPLTVLATVPARRYVIKGGAVVAETRTAHWVQTQAPAAAG